MRTSRKDCTVVLFQVAHVLALRPAAEGSELAPASCPAAVPQAPLRTLQATNCLVGKMRVGSARAETTRRLQRVLHIGYYRLSGYALPFQIGGTGAGRHDFKPGVTFDDILDRYVFDRKLRLLVIRWLRVSAFP